MASPQVQAAWREAYKARKKHVAVPESARRILNEYRRPGSREYQRKKRRAYRDISPALFQALRDRGIPSYLINLNSRKLKPRDRYLVVGRVYRDCRQSLAILHRDTEDSIIETLALAPYPAIVIDTKEIH